MQLKRMLFITAFILLFTCINAVRCQENESFNEGLHRKSVYEQMPNHGGEIIFLGKSITMPRSWKGSFDDNRTINIGIGVDLRDGILLRPEDVTNSCPTEIIPINGTNDLKNSKSALKTSTAHFTHGVASGDPQQDGVLLWTRLDPGNGKDSTLVHWEISDSETFDSGIRSGTAYSLKAHDYCVKVWADSLQPGTRYSYRFRHNGLSSPMGKTQTLHTSTDTVRIAVVNCGKFEGGFFNVYDAVSRMESIQAVIHLGDYIYEDAGGFGPYAAIVERTGRGHIPANKLVSLQDYRTRYAQYRSDSMLQRLHATYPMINIWDDHESANDAWKDDAQAHDPKVDGSWEARKSAAVQAYSEWIPIRANPSEPIYRSFQFGDIVNLSMLDTRLCCRSKQARSPGEMDSLYNTSTLLGPEQTDWLIHTITQNSATWNLIGNQVLVARGYAIDGKHQISWDQWTGYPKERSELLNWIKMHPEKNVLITTGNVHDAFHFELLDSDEEKSGGLIAHEFAPGSVSSGNSFVKKSQSELTDFEYALSSANPHLKWFELIDHSFMVIEFTEDKARVIFYTVNTVYDTKYQVEEAYAIDVYPHKG